MLRFHTFAKKLGKVASTPRPAEELTPGQRRPLEEATFDGRGSTPVECGRARAVLFARWYVGRYSERRQNIS